jgi:hypothetical protein
MKCLEQKVLLFTLFLFSGVLKGAPYREPLSRHFLHKKAEKQGSFFISSIDELKNKVLAPEAAPALVCITCSLFPSAEVIHKTVQDASAALLSKVQFLIVDVKNEGLLPFVMQVKQQLGLVNLPLPAFVFFQKSAIVLPVQAGLISAPELTELTRKRFHLS